MADPGLDSNPTHPECEVCVNSKVRILNMDVDNITMDELLDKREGTILTLHVDMIAKLQRDRELYDLVRRFDVITCDSQVLYLAARVLGTPLKARVSGSDYFPRFCTRYKDDPSVTVYLCGAMEGIAQRAMVRINEKVGRRMVVGAYGPPVDYETRPGEIEKILGLINESGASVLVAGLGVPKQERFITRYRDVLPSVRLFLPLGGTIDYEAGDVRRPPPWITDAGLEWLFRLAREPRRRWYRYLVHQPPVLFYLAQQALGVYADPFASTEH
jgi:N-acetylglucosaminyldiphosphoundecaprenol N-acetyl-beta-D-mannosaminyltransferase